MNRREFIAGLGSAVALPLAARAQQPAMPVIGFLASDRRDESLRAFRQGLSETGFVEGRNVAVEYSFAEGRYERLPALAADLVRRRVAVIAAFSTPCALAAKAATQSIPIVFSVGVDPVQVGLVASLARPSGNLTGVSSLINETVAKRVEILREVAPSAGLVALLTNPANPVPAAAEVTEAQRAARILGVDMLILNVGTLSEIEAAFATISGQRAGALLVGVDAFFRNQREQIVALAARDRVPAMYMFRESPSVGGLMSYGTDNVEPVRQVGIYSGRILNDDKPADLPVQQAVKVELVLNLKTAKALGLTIPETLLATADEVIQ
jgi:putative tryptophan/tyrosine transport system substrate-binding protein